MARSSAAKRPTFASKGSTLCGQTSVLVWLNAVRALRAWKQTVAILVAPPVVTIILVLLQLLANVVVDKEGERPRGSGADLAGKLAPLFARLAGVLRRAAVVLAPRGDVARGRHCQYGGLAQGIPCARC